MLCVKSTDSVQIRRIQNAPSFDGHSLRAQTYFSENMPDIERAPEGAKCYKALVGEREIYFHEFEIIEYMGEQMTGADLVRRLSQ